MTSTIPNSGDPRERGLFCAVQPVDSMPDVPGGWIEAVRALLPPDHAAEQADFDEFVAALVTQSLPRTSDDSGWTAPGDTSPWHRPMIGGPR